MSQTLEPEQERWNPEIARLQGKYKRSTTQVYTWLGGLYNKGPKESVNYYVTLAERAVLAHIKMPKHILEALNTAISLREEAAAWFKEAFPIVTMGNPRQRHEHVIGVLKNIREIFHSGNWSPSQTPRVSQKTSSRNPSPSSSHQSPSPNSTTPPSPQQTRETFSRDRSASPPHISPTSSPSTPYNAPKSCNWRQKSAVSLPDERTYRQRPFYPDQQRYTRHWKSEPALRQGSSKVDDCWKKSSWR